MQVWLMIFVSFCILYWFVPQKRMWILFLATSIALAVMAFHCLPSETDDLSNYYVQLEYLRRGGWHTFQQMLRDNNNNWSSLPVCGYYFYVISRLNDNGYLPAITIFIAYFSMFYCFYKAAIRFEIDKWYLFLGSVFLFVTYWYFDICSGVRNGLAFTVFIVCIYFDVVEQKNRPLCYLGYLLCMGFHSSVIILVALRCVLFITRKNDSKWVFVGMLLAISVCGNILQMIGEATGIQYLQLLSEKAANNMGREILWSKSYIYINSSVLLLTLLLGWYFSKFIKESEKYDEIKEYSKFFWLISFFTAGAFTSQLIYIRIIRWIIPLVGGLVFMVGMKCCNEVQKKARKPLNVKSIIIGSESVLEVNELLITLFFIAYTIVHLWYTCKGTSLIWFHFR